VARSDLQFPPSWNKATQRCERFARAWTLAATALYFHHNRLIAEAFSPVHPEAHH
jgi:hypothetical protein